MKIFRVIAFIILDLMFLALAASAQQPHATLAKQQMCAKQAAKFFKEMQQPDHAIRFEYLSHYDATVEACYIRVDTAQFLNGLFSNSSGIWDAFEQRNYAYFLNYGELGECWAKPLGKAKVECHSSDEFEALVDKHFGLGE